nr:hypothetical protein CFP56_24223 [Quercus suber]
MTDSLSCRSTRPYNDRSIAGLKAVCVMPKRYSSKCPMSFRLAHPRDSVHNPSTTSAHAGNRARQSGYALKYVMLDGLRYLHVLASRE